MTTLSYFFIFCITLHSQVFLCFCHNYSYTAFVFGDSLVDAGNNNYLITLSKADSPPYGLDFTPSHGQPTGRFTNGRTIADIIGEALGAKSFAPPYLSPNSAANSFDIGINYASGASGILDQTGTLFIGRLPLKEQVNDFEKTREYMVNAVGEENTNNFLKNAIFSITIGSNDVLNYFQPIFSTNRNIPPTLFQEYMVFNLTLQLQRLQKLGARKFVVTGVGPLGCIPFIRATNLIPSGKCSSRVNTFVRNYNQKLKEEIHKMNDGLNSIFVYANSYDIFREVILEHKKYGFEKSDGPCCGGYFPPFICHINKGRRNASSSSSYSSLIVCEDRNKYVFWDAYHPSEAANVVVADKLLNGDLTNSFPINIRQLFNYDLG